VKAVIWLLGIFAVVGFVGGSVALIATSDKPEQTYVDLLDIVVSWPLALLVLGCLAIALLREPLARYIERAGETKLEAGLAKLSVSPLPPSDTPKAEPPTEIAEEELKEQGVGDLAAYWHGQAITWFFEYLHARLPPISQSVLQWFDSAGQQGIARPELDFIENLPGIKYNVDRILADLYKWGLISAGAADRIFITPAGHNFVEFIQQRSVAAFGGAAQTEAQNGDQQ
jgi:hypothetical protein